MSICLFYVHRRFWMTQCLIEGTQLLLTSFLHGIMRKLRTKITKRLGFLVDAFTIDKKLLRWINYRSNVLTIHTVCVELDLLLNAWRITIDVTEVFLFGIRTRKLEGWYVVMVSLQGSFIAYFVIIAAFGLLGTWAGSGTNLPLSCKRVGELLQVVASGKRSVGCITFLGDSLSIFCWWFPT